MLTKFSILLIFIAFDGSYVGVDSIGVYKTYDDCVSSQEAEKQTIRKKIESFDRDFHHVSVKCKVSSFKI